MSSEKEWEEAFESLDESLDNKNNYVFDRIRWFVFAQEQMTKEQLVFYSEDFGLGGSVNYNALKEDLKEEINYALARQYWYNWNELIRIVEEFWESGKLYYDPNWTHVEPNWRKFSHDDGKAIPKITGSTYIEDNKFYQRLIKYSYSPPGEVPAVLKKIRPRELSKLEKIWTEPIYESENRIIESPSNIIIVILGTVFVIFFVSIFFYDYSFI